MVYYAMTQRVEMCVWVYVIITFLHQVRTGSAFRGLEAYFVEP
jgi:hypothetical protein